MKRGGTRDAAKNYFDFKDLLAFGIFFCIFQYVIRRIGVRVIYDAGIP